MVSTMEQPSCSSSRTTCHSASRACTSRPTVGSSRNSSSGRPTDRQRELHLALLAAGELAVGAVGEALERQALDHARRRRRESGSSSPPARAARAGASRRAASTSCIITPMRRRPSISCGSWPNSSAEPASARCRPSRMEMAVDLPAPLGPSRASSSPRFTARSKPSSAVDLAEALACACEAGECGLRHVFLHGAESCRARRAGLSRRCQPALLTTVMCGLQRSGW